MTPTDSSASSKDRNLRSGHTATRCLRGIKELRGFAFPGCAETEPPVSSSVMCR